MNINIRRAIALTFIIAFLITAPLLILYTAGYRYSWKKQKISHTGTLVLASKPRGATITLNDYQIAEKTPARLTNLFPNEYIIEIKKPGYYPWKKKLPIYSQNTTFAENIILFKQAPEKNLLNREFNNPEYLEADEKLFYQTTIDNIVEFHVYDFSKNKDQVFFSFDKTRQNLIDYHYSKNFKYLYVNLTDKETVNHNLYQIITIGHEKPPINLVEQLGQLTLNSFVWSPEQENDFYYLTKDTIFQAKIGLLDDITREKITDIKPEFKILDFQIFNNQLYFIERQKDNIFIAVKDLKSKKEIYGKIMLDDDGYRIKEIVDDKIIIVNENRRQLYLLNSTLDAVLLSENDIIGYDYNEKENKFLVYSDNEILTTDFNFYPFELKTITRVSSGITKAFWYNEPNYLIFIKDQKINLIELDERDRRNLVTLPATGVTHVWQSKNSEQLYFIKNNNELFEQEIFE